MENQNSNDKDHELKQKMCTLLMGLNYECRASFDDPNRILCDDKKLQLIESDGVFYDSATHSVIYLETTTQNKKLTKKLDEKHNNLVRYAERLEQQLNLDGKVEKRILLFVSDGEPGGDLDKINQDKISISLLQASELENYYLYLFAIIGSHLRYEFSKEVLRLNEKDNPVTIDAIKINMSGTPAYLFELSVDKILKTCYVFRKKEVLDKGYQRILNDKKLKNISDFLKSPRAAIFPNSILINLEGKVKEITTANEDKKETDNSSNSQNFVRLEYPMRSNSYRIIDGQHRIYGYCKSNQNLENAKLIIVAFKNVPNPEDERRFFIKINKSQTRIDPGLLDLLMAETNFDEKEDEFWDSMGAKLALELNKDGPYKDRIYTGISLKDGKKDKATLSYIAERTRRSKLLTYKKKNRQGVQEKKDGILQTQQDVRNLSIPVKILNECMKTILETPSDENTKQSFSAFFISNRGFDLLCRLIKAYCKTPSDIKTLSTFLKELNFDGTLINSFSGLYGAGGMAQIAHKTQEHIRKNEKYKNFKLV